MSKLLQLSFNLFITCVSALLISPMAYSQASQATDDYELIDNTGLNLLTGQLWKTSNIQVFFQSNVPQDSRNEIMRAFEMWQYASGLTFTIVSTLPSTNFIEVGFSNRQGLENMLNPPKPASTVLARTVWNGNVESGNITTTAKILFNLQDFSFSASEPVPLNQYHLRTVAVHEIGHALGLAHSSTNPSEPDSKLLNSVMYFSFASQAIKNITQYDIHDIYTLYNGNAPVVDVATMSPEAIIGDVRNNIGYRYVMSGGKGLLLDTAAWNSCPSGYTYFGNNMSVDGFWLCVRNDQNNRRFTVGDVTNHSGYSYQLYYGKTNLGSASWNSCPTGTLLGTDYHSNGFWICKGGIVYTGPEAYIGDVRNNTGYFYSVSNGSVGFAGTAGWNYCPGIYQLVGTSFHSNGFWLCARPDFVNSYFFVGDVTNNSGPSYWINSGNIQYWGGYSWNSCPFGSLIGTDFHSNGFWICRQ